MQPQILNFFKSRDTNKEGCVLPHRIATVVQKLCVERKEDLHCTFFCPCSFNQGGRHPKCNNSSKDDKCVSIVELHSDPSFRDALAFNEPLFLLSFLSHLTAILNSAV